MKFNAWGLVILGGLFETGWSTTMKLSEGFTILPYDIVTLVLLLISTYLLDMGLKAGLPVGACYAVWVGTGAVGSIVVGSLAFGEAIGTIGFLFLALIIAGVIGMNLSSSEESKEEQ